MRVPSLAISPPGTSKVPGGSDKRKRRSLMHLGWVSIREEPTRLVEAVCFEKLVSHRHESGVSASDSMKQEFALAHQVIRRRSACILVLDGGSVSLSHAQIIAAAGPRPTSANCDRRAKSRPWTAGSSR